MVDLVNGHTRVRAWPTKRGKPKTAKAKQLQESFRNANEACKYWDPRNIVSIDKLRAGTPVLIRDLQIMMMYNRFAHFALPDGRVIYSVQARQDVSASLDSISPVPGAILIRTVDGWRYVAPPTIEGEVLTSTPDGLAAWGALPPASEWGDITGNITDQTDLQDEFTSLMATVTAALAGKQSTGTALLIAANLADIANAATARGNLGLGAAATKALTFFLQAANNLSDLPSVATARANLSVYSKADVDALLATGGSGAAIPTLGAPDGMIVGTATPAVNNYLMALIVADHAFTISKLALYAYTATPTSKFQPFVYQCNAAFTAATALLASGPQVTGMPIGYNEIPLTAPVTIAKGQAIWVGFNVTVAALNILTKAGGVNGAVANGASTVPANPAPAISTATAYGGCYAFWGV